MKSLFIANRERFGERMENGSILVIFAGSAPVKRGDEFYPFAPQRNFYYMTGIDKPNLIFTMAKSTSGKLSSTLYLERFDDYMAKWVGGVIKAEEAENISGIDSFKYLDEFDNLLSTLFVRSNITKVYADMENRSLQGAVSPDIELVCRLQKKFPYISCINAYPVFARLRSVKSHLEVGLIKQALNITDEAFKLVLKNVKSGMKEYELEAYFDFVVKKSGCRDRAFATIMASGKNAAVLHYTQNDSVMQDGDLVLMDFGAQVGWYSADITRTFPVSGVFSERQKQLYNIVLAANQIIISIIKPGVPFAKLNETLVDFYFTELKKIGLVNEKKEIAKYYYHGVSHMLGLETHDIGRGTEDVLEAGMVLTVEPGLYLLDEGIGIRIEDDVLVTLDGREVLSAGIIKTAEEIEEFMRNR